MKKSKKFLSILCAVCIMLATAAPALAVNYPDYVPMEPPVTVTFDQIGDLNANTTTQVGDLEPAVLLLPYNSGSGISGASICFFTADTKNFSFAMRLTPGSGGSGSNYHIQLWQINPDGSETKIGDAVQYNFNDGPYWENKLTVGNEYYVKVSSTTVDRNGADCQYVSSTEEHASFS